MASWPVNKANNGDKNFDELLVQGMHVTQQAAPPPLRPRTRKVRVHRKGKLPQYLREEQGQSNDNASVPVLTTGSNATQGLGRSLPCNNLSDLSQREESRAATLEQQHANGSTYKNIVRESSTSSIGEPRIDNVQSTTTVQDIVAARCETEPATGDADDDEAAQRRARIQAARRLQSRTDSSSSSDEDSDDDDVEVARRAPHIQAGAASSIPHHANKLEEETTQTSNKIITTETSATKSSSESDSSSSDSSDSESSSDEEILPPGPLVQPKFVSREERHTLREEEERLKLEEQKEFELEREEEERKMVTRNMNAAAVERDHKLKEKRKILKKQAGLGGLIMVTDFANRPDDTDIPNDEAELEAWKLRELARGRREEERKRLEAEEARETQRRRNMTEEERIAEDEELIRKGLKKGHGEKEQRSFLQKYYHKGAFFMDDDSIAKDESKSSKPDVRRADYSKPTSLEKFDKTSLPKVMQVKNFGRSGQTKWTHLANEDTSNLKDNLWAQSSSKRKAGTDSASQAGAKRKR